MHKLYAAERLHIYILRIHTYIYGIYIYYTYIYCIYIHYIYTSGNLNTSALGGGKKFWGPALKPEWKTHIRCPRD